MHAAEWFWVSYNLNRNFVGQCWGAVHFNWRWTVPFLNIPAKNKIPRMGINMLTNSENQPQASPLTTHLRFMKYPGWSISEKINIFVCFTSTALFSFYLLPLITRFSHPYPRPLATTNLLSVSLSFFVFFFFSPCKREIRRYLSLSDLCPSAKFLRAHPCCHKWQDFIFFIWLNKIPLWRSLWGFLYI